jgi:Uma2 family endonuclease
MGMALTKPAGAWTYDDLFALPDDGKRYEIIEGELYEMPAPESAHAFTIVNLLMALYPIVAGLGGRVATAPLDVFFAGANPVQPDIVVLLAEGNARVVRRGIEGPPDLLIEALSASNRGHDLLTKRALYARGGIREYWIVDPGTRSVEILSLDRDAFHQVAVHSGREPLHSPLLGSFSTATDDLFPNIEP